MTPSLNGLEPLSTYTWLLHAQASGPLDATTPRVLCLGDGTTTPLSFTTTGLYVGGNKVVTSTLTINGHALSANISLTAMDVMAVPFPQAAGTGGVMNAVVNGSYVVTVPTLFIDPTTRVDGSALQSGDSYAVFVQGGVATFTGSVDTFSAGDVSYRRTWNGTAWLFHYGENKQVVPITADTQLTQDHDGKVLLVESACTLTLPVWSTTPIGPFELDIIWVGTTGNVTVSPGGGNVLTSASGILALTTRYAEATLRRTVSQGGGQSYNLAAINDTPTEIALRTAPVAITANTTLTAAHCGKTLLVSASCTITMPASGTIQGPFECSVIVTNTGQTVTFAAGSGNTLNAASSHLHLAIPYAKASLLLTAPNTYNLSGTDS